MLYGPIVVCEHLLSYYFFSFDFSKLSFNVFGRQSLRFQLYPTVGITLFAHSYLYWDFSTSKTVHWYKHSTVSSLKTTQVLHSEL